ncbi:MAG: DUF192 domain-containing protein [Parcubacteria group bacterium]|nr:DUF192 domain-containing protein [Parcubacteria group bacterium]
MGHPPLKIIGLPILAALIVALGFYALPMLMGNVLKTQLIRIGETQLTAYVADTPVLQAKGLGGRESLEPDFGMLFPYAEPAVRNFWMKDMRFPLDVIWIAGGAVAGFTEDIPVWSGEGDYSRFSSFVPADAALEVNAGWVREHGITLGMRVDIGAK